MKKILLYILLFFSSKIVCQVRPASLPDVFPPSPNAASIGKYEEIPVGLYTGIPQVSVPMFNIKSKRLSLAVGLSYHAGGVKVEDKASNVGLGWSLQAGGIITRSMRGRPDEELGVGFFSGSYPTNQVGTNAAYAKQAADGLIDTQPDIFYFNFGGYSGKFFFDQSGKIYSGFLNKFVVKPSIGANPRSGGWSILTEDGTEYIFEHTEEETVRNICTNGSGVSLTVNNIGSYTSAWYLTKIISPDHTDEITFEYGGLSSEVIYKTLGSETKYIKDSDTPQITGTPPRTYCDNEIKVRMRSLTKINFANGYLHFSYGITPRTDIPNAPTLKRVGLYTTTNEQLREFVLDHEYFIYESSLTHLKLNSVKEQKSTFSPTGLPGQSVNVLSSLPAYQFTYFDRTDNLTANSYRYAQDHWGYFNGKDNALYSFIPERTIRYSNGNYVFMPGANRDPYLEAAKTFTLKRITYPTGGFTDFDYELHDCIEPTLPYFKKASSTSITVSNLNTTSQSFEIKSYDASGKIPVKINLTTQNCNLQNPGPGCELNEITNCPVIKIEKCNKVLGTCNWSENGPNNYAGNISNCTTFLTDGIYRIKGPSSGNYTFTLTFTEKEVEILANGDVSPNKKAGGLRIKKIITSNGDSDPNPLKKVYFYKESDGFSSGKILSVPLYSYPTKICQTANIPGCVVTNYIANTSFSNVSLGTASGSFVCYTKVTVLHGENGENGKEVHDFSFQLDNVSISFPFGPSTSLDPYRGLPKQKIAYRKEGSSGFQEVEMDINTHNLTAFNPLKVPGIKVGYKIEGWDANYSTTLDNFAFTNFNERTDWLYLQSVKQRYYASNSTNYSEAEQTFEYDPTHLQLKNQTRTNSDGIKYITAFRYPADYQTSSNTLAEMKGVRNIQNAVVEKFDKVQNGNGAEKLLQATQNTYGILNNRVILEKIAQTELNEPSNISNSPVYTDQQTFKYDDATGNLIEVKGRDNSYTSYLWGYGGALPIAEVKNASFAQVQTALSAMSLSLTQVNALSNEQDIRTKMSDFRSRLPLSLVVSYTYQPHIGNTSTTNPTDLKTFYLFDEFGRLTEVKNDKSETVSSYKYNFKNQ